MCWVVIVTFIYVLEHSLSYRMKRLSRQKNCDTLCYILLLLRSHFRGPLETPLSQASGKHHRPQESLPDTRLALLEGRRVALSSHINSRASRFLITFIFVKRTRKFMVKIWAEWNVACGHFLYIVLDCWLID